MKLGFEGRSVGFGKSATILLLSLERTACARTRPSEVPGEPLERRDWNQRASCGLVGARVAAQALTPAIPLKDRLYLLRAERNPGRPRRTANVPRRRGVHLRLCASGSLASDAQLCPASSPRLALPIAVGRSVTVIFQHPGFPGSRGRRAAENSSLLHNRQPSKLSARPAAPPGRPARSFRTNIPTHTSMRAPPAPPEPPNQT